jgi:hypothetical protein
MIFDEIFRCHDLRPGRAEFASQMPGGGRPIMFGPVPDEFDPGRSLHFVKKKIDPGLFARIAPEEHSDRQQKRKSSQEKSAHERS